MSSLKLSEIWIYPVKSLPGIRLTEVEVTDRGLAFDRRWMLIDASGQFISLRQFPQLSQFEISIAKDCLEVNPKQNAADVCTIPLTPKTDNFRPVRVWNDEMSALSVCNEADLWFSQHLGLQVHLVFMPDSTRRLVNTQYAYNGEIVSFADGYPIMLIGQSSLNELNTRVTEKVTMQRFRPNLVVSGGQPFEEDNWDEISIDRTIKLKLAKPCSRCIMVNVDPETGLRKNEVLKTLAEYRQVKNKILFGQNLLIQTTGILKEGATIDVVYSTH